MPVDRKPDSASRRGEQAVGKPQEWTEETLICINCGYVQTNRRECEKCKSISLETPFLMARHAHNATFQPPDSASESELLRAASECSFEAGRGVERALVSEQQEQVVENIVKWVTENIKAVFLVGGGTYDDTCLRKEVTFQIATLPQPQDDFKRVQELASQMVAVREALGIPLSTFEEVIAKIKQPQDDTKRLDSVRIDFVEQEQADVTYDVRRAVFEVNCESGIYYSNSVRAAIDKAMQENENKT